MKNVNAASTVQKVAPATATRAESAASSSKLSSSSKSFSNQIRSVNAESNIINILSRGCFGSLLIFPTPQLDILTAFVSL